MNDAPPASPPGRSIRRLLVFFVLLFLASAVYRPLWEPDEGRYTAAALEMLRAGDWWRPALNPEQPHFSKPPVIYWSLMPGLSWFGRREWAARLPNMAAWIAVLALLAEAGRRFRPGAGGIPALVFASSAFPFVAFSFVTPDILLSLFELIAATGFLFARYRPGKQDSRFWLTLAYAALGAGFLTKGPPVLLPWIAWGITAALLRDRAARQQAAWWPGVIVFLLLGCAWYVAAIAYEPRLLSFFLRGEVVDRIFTSAHGRNPQWYKGFVMYGGILAVGFLPWAPWALRALRGRSDGWFQRLKETEPWSLYFAVWLALGLAVFLLVPSRLPLYILPLAAPVAWLLARSLPESALLRTGTRRALAAWGLAMLLGVVAASHSESKAGSRGLARFLQQENLLPAEEIVFVESRPYYGLVFYTGAEVERCDLVEPRPLPGAPFLSFETVLEEIQREQEARLWIVKGTKYESFKKKLVGRAVIVADTGPAYRDFCFVKTETAPGSARAFMPGPPAAGSPVVLGTVAAMKESP
ncbi:MAG TPA: glycosyltransferase family 39 protein [Kiritimatiellia bacterium]|nr:glycosyltransferase family 39 protein [Kiritimatiellia bacterium]HRZ13441.1 glycosyltransferase family 39 protein [Kiritimatiellia bacterium]HSA18919.1 glycosyltransferase family 39 protein [Kiritimatiellia bacterium]